MVGEDRDRDRERDAERIPVFSGGERRADDGVKGRAERPTMATIDLFFFLGEGREDDETMMSFSSEDRSK